MIRDPRCRFDGGLFDAGAKTFVTAARVPGWRPGDAWHAPDGRPWVLIYHCGDCDWVHWTAPALECDGSCPDHASAVLQACAVLRAAGHTVPDAEVEATIAAGLPAFARNLRRTRVLEEIA